MKLVSDDLCEFRIKREYTSKNTGKKSYFYTFENDHEGSFELWSNDNIGLVKGTLYQLVFDLQFFNGERRVSLKEVIPVE